MKHSHYLGKTIHIMIDRPMGSQHPIFGFEYPINYGFVPNTLSGDGEELDAYFLGATEPLSEATGQCIAIIHRLHEDDDKLIIAAFGLVFTDDEIRHQIAFQEKWFESEIIR